jgi:hypothetical protein
VAHHGYHDNKELRMFASHGIQKSREIYKLCPPPSSSGPNTSGGGHRKPANGDTEPPKKPVTQRAD